jgi:hypothetical protein
VRIARHAGWHEENKLSERVREKLNGEGHEEDKNTCTSLKLRGCSYRTHLSQEQVRIWIFLIRLSSLEIAIKSLGHTSLLWSAHQARLGVASARLDKLDIVPCFQPMSR